MVNNFNFGAADTFVPEGYILDFGEAYSEERGYGWVEEDDLTTPLDLTPNGRDRDVSNIQITDTLMHLDYPISSGRPDAVRIPGAWQYDVPNGQYRVALSVGDNSYYDSIHEINIEGENVIDNFIPTEEEPFATARELVTVNDGQLTIDSIGGQNTKLNYVRVTPVIDTKVNFGLENTEGVPEDYLIDFGEAYDETRGYGWITQDSVDSGDSVPLDITGNTRSRNVLDDKIFDSLIHLQYPESSEVPNVERTPAAWEYEIPDGQYEVRVGVGDRLFTDSVHAINIEGVEAISDFVPSPGALFTTAREIVEVTDGRLTIDAIGGENTKLNFVEISTVDTDMMG